MPRKGVIFVSSVRFVPHKKHSSTIYISYPLLSKTDTGCTEDVDSWAWLIGYYCNDMDYDPSSDDDAVIAGNAAYIDLCLPGDNQSG